MANNFTRITDFLIDIINLTILWDFLWLHLKLKPENKIVFISVYLTVEVAFYFVNDATEWKSYDVIAPFCLIFKFPIDFY